MCPIFFRLVEKLINSEYKKQKEEAGKKKRKSIMIWNQLKFNFIPPK